MAEYHRVTRQGLKGYFALLRCLTRGERYRAFIPVDCKGSNRLTQPWFLKLLNNNINKYTVVGTIRDRALPCKPNSGHEDSAIFKSREKTWRGGNKQVPAAKTRRSVWSGLNCVSGYSCKMLSDALFDDDCGATHDDSQEDVMTPAQLIAKLEEVSERSDGLTGVTDWCDWCDWRSVLCTARPGWTRGSRRSCWRTSRRWWSVWWSSWLTW